MLAKIKESLFWRMVFWYVLAIVFFAITVFNPLINHWSAQFINIEELSILYKIPAALALVLMLFGSFLATVFCGLGGLANYLCYYLSELKRLVEEGGLRWD